MSDAPKYKGHLLPDIASVEDLRPVVSDYVLLLVDVMQVMADRYERRPDYPFIDTKMDVVTGKDFDPDDPKCGLQTIYGRIQGRGLEALAAHCLWLKANAYLQGIAGAPALVARLERMMRAVLHQLHAMWRRNDGHLYYTMTPDGAPLEIVTNPAGTHSRKPLHWDPSFYQATDIFTSKGMLAAAHYLDERAILEDAHAYSLAVWDATKAGRVTNPDFGFDPAKGPAFPLGHRSQSPYMLQLGTATELLRARDDRTGVEMGLACLDQLFRHFVNLSERMPGLLLYDYVDRIYEDGSPFVENGRILSTPGLAIEFVGLALKFTTAAKNDARCAPLERQRLTGYESLLPLVLGRNFDTGYQGEVEGIASRVELRTRAIVDGNLPAWKLTESLRAAILAVHAAPTTDEVDACLDVLTRAHNAFVRHYVRPDLHLLAYPARNPAGTPIGDHKMPDFDPGYHIGMCIIDVLDALTT